MKNWNKNTFGCCNRRIEQLHEELDAIQQYEPTTYNLNREISLQFELDEQLARKDLMWTQKSRELWVHEGDRNTKFFHLSTVIRRRKNHISAIKTPNGEREYGMDKIGNYFLKVFLYNLLA